MEPRPVINVQEKIGRTVGKRRQPKDALAAGLANQTAANQWIDSFGHRLGPKGVFRFRSFEEADAWTMRNLRPNKAMK